MSKPSHHGHVLRAVDPASRTAADPRDRRFRRWGVRRQPVCRARACSRAATSRSGLTPGGQLLQLGHGPGRGRAAVADGAGHPAVEHPVALQHLDPQAAVLEESPQRRRASSRRRSASSGPKRPSGSVSRARASASRPARVRDEHRRVPAGDQHGDRGTGAGRGGERGDAAAGSSTTSSRPCPSTRSAQPAGTTSPSASASPCTARDEVGAPRRRAPGAAGRPARSGWCRRR